MVGETQQGASPSSSNQRETSTSARSRAEDTGSQDTCSVFVVLQPHTPAFQGSMAQSRTAPEPLFHGAKGWRGINNCSTQQQPAFSGLKASDLYTPFHTQLSQNTSWMLLQTQRCPGKHLISHTMIWIQALSQTQACWIFASSVVIQIGFLVRLPTPQQQHEGKAVLLFFRGKAS